MIEANAVADELRNVHSLIIGLAESVLRLAELLDQPVLDPGAGSTFLTEDKMAERLGTTLAALRTRRFRKQIPDSVWMKQGRKALYNVQAYEAWLEMEWQGRMCNLAATQQLQRQVKRRKSYKLKHGQAPYPLLV